MMGSLSNNDGGFISAPRTSRDAASEQVVRSQVHRCRGGGPTPLLYPPRSPVIEPLPGYESSCQTFIIFYSYNEPHVDVGSSTRHRWRQYGDGNHASRVSQLRRESVTGRRGVLDLRWRSCCIHALTGSGNLRLKKARYMLSDDQ